MTNCNNVNDLMIQAAKALMDRDTEKLEDLRQVVAGWLQCDEETDAQNLLLDAMLEAAFDLE